MPIYEYKCRACGAVTEVLVMSAAGEKSLSCRSCGGDDLVKTPSRPAGVGSGNPGRKGRTCCGKKERCETPPCSSGGRCRRD